MKVAIDCVGTLLAEEYTDKLIEFIKDLQSKEHQVTIWSSSVQCLDEAEKLLTEEKIPDICYCTKYSKKDALSLSKIVFDLAIDDDPMSSYYLAAAKFIHPRDVTNETT